MKWPRARAALVPALIAAIGACHDGRPAPDGGSFGGAGGQGGADLHVDAGPLSDAAPEAGCGDAGVEDAGTGCEGLDGGAGYADVAPIFAQRCGGELCHAVPTRAVLVGMPAGECCDGRLLVAPGDAARSYLMAKLTGHDLCAGQRMPLGAPALADGDVLTVRRWICAGAPAE